MSLPHAHHLPQGAVKIVTRKIVECVDGKNEIKIPIGKRQFGSLSFHNTIPHLPFGMFDGIAADFQSRDFKAGNRLGEIIKQKALSTADIQNLVTRLEAIVSRHEIRHLAPAPIIIHSAIAGAPIAIPILDVPLRREFRSSRFRIFRIIDACQIVTRGCLVNRRYEVCICHDEILTEPARRM